MALHKGEDRTYYWKCLQQTFWWLTQWLKMIFIIAVMNEIEGTHSTHESWILTLTSLNSQNLLCHNRQHLKINTVEFIEAWPSSTRCQTLSTSEVTVYIYALTYVQRQQEKSKFHSSTTVMCNVIYTLCKMQKRV